MVFDELDRPWCRFPGVYVSMPASYFDHRYQRAWAYFPRPEREPPTEAPDLLFSFVGSMTHKCRPPLLKLRGEDVIVAGVSGFTFYDRSSQDFQARRQRFDEILRRSRFVLCPRGQGTASIRIFETLAVGRVPVIISDEWVPPDDADWSHFSLRWPEGRVTGLREFLREHDDRWQEMSLAATAAYAEFFAPDIWFHRLAELCEEVRQDAPFAFPSGGIRGRAFFAAGAHAWQGRVHEWRGRLRRWARDAMRLGSRS
jgi:exostosin family protein